MYNCVPCHRHMSTWKLFKTHMLAEHQVNERNLARRVAQVLGREVYAIRSELGQWFIYAQPELL